MCRILDDLLHNLHFVHYLPSKIQILLREQCDKNAEDNKSMKSKQFRLISAATLYQASGWAGRGWPAGRSSSPVQQLDPRTPAGSCSVLVTSEQLPVSSQLPAADCLLRSLGRAQLRPADGYNNTALYRVTATSHPPPLSVNLSYFQ